MCAADQSRFRDYGCDNSHFMFVRTTCCGGCAVEDDELDNLFFVAFDLSARISLLYDPRSSVAPPCPMCGSEVWELTEIRTLSDVSDEWRWAFVSE